MYEIFLKLLQEKGVTAYKVGKETGIASSTFTDWKNGRSVPGTDKLIKIADFFGVSVEYLKTGKEPEYTIEIANTDIALTNMSEKLKTYALKMSELSKENQEFIMKMIDKLEESKVK